MATINQKITNKYAVYHGDCTEVMVDIPSNSIGMEIHSPPFGDLYSYSDSYKDLSNCKSYSEFFKHYDFVVEQLHRILMPGRISVVHCMDLPMFKSKGQDIGFQDFSGDIIRLFQKHGFVFHSRHCIWKDPLIAATRTKAIGLAHKQIVKDSSVCRTGVPDYIVAFRKKGDNPKPIQHPEGFTEYIGSRSIPRDLDRYGGVNPFTLAPWIPKENKKSHWIWQQYASPVWFDIRQSRVLSYRGGRSKEDQKHICPLQLDVVDRCLILWSGEGDTVLTPFMGIGTEVYCAVKMKRKGLGVELKKSYYKQALKNLEALKLHRQSTQGEIEV